MQGLCNTVSLWFLDCFGAMTAPKTGTLQQMCSLFPLTGSSAKRTPTPFCPTALRGAFTDPCAAEQRGQRGGQDGCQDPNFDLRTGSLRTKA